ncbi:MAG: serine/threonine-protein kinase [Gammaproteobacteria bacterium]|jgi:serine/threonine protein kinase
MQPTPEKIGKYQILGIAGRGSMGVVYIGHDPFVDRRVAIKICSNNNSDEGSSRLARRLFFNEAQSAGSLDHPNILKVFDAGEDNKQPYIVMEYVDGGNTLRQYCDEANLLPLETVAHIVQQCAEALDYAHRRHVTHRDIKPANIMLTADGVVKIVDFGVAQRTHTDRTQILGTFGSPRYMAPEQATDEAVTGQADLYSLGVVVYELLTGKPPFDAQGISALMYKILTEDPVPIRSIRSEVPDLLASVVSRALSKDLSIRYQTGSEMAADLAVALRALEQLPGITAAAMTFEDKVSTVKSLYFFREFADAEISEVVEVVTWESYSPGELIISEGDESGAFFVIASGQGSVTKGGTRIGTIEKGDCFGEMGYLSGQLRSASVTAVKSVLALKFDSPIAEWASLPCQVRFTKAFQKTLITKLASVSEHLSTRTS